MLFKFKLQNTFAALAIGLLSILYGCMEVTGVERGRIVSPNGELDAVLVEWPTNATSDSIFGLVLLPHSKALPKDMHAIVTGSKIMLVNVHWDDNEKIEIAYPATSKIYSFQNQWYSSADHNEGKNFKAVEIILERR